MNREDFDIVDTGKAHPEPKWASHTIREVRYNGKLVQYVYEGAVETMEFYSTSDYLPIFEQALDFASFDRERAIFHFDD